MTEVIFTFRPLSWRHISWVNFITRAVRKAPFDHSAIKIGAYIYQSTAGKGVHKIHFDKWVKDRKNTYLFIYRVPRSVVSVEAFHDLHGKKYDYLANIAYLFNLRFLLKKNPNKRIYCSELNAAMLEMKNPYEVAPDDLELYLRPNYPLEIVEIT